MKKRFEWIFSPAKKSKKPGCTVYEINGYKISFDFVTGCEMVVKPGGKIISLQDYLKNQNICK